MHIMREKLHGTAEVPCQKNLRYGCDFETADKICCFNKKVMEPAEYAFQEQRTWLADLQALAPGSSITYYDSVTGKPLIIAP